LKYVHYGVRLVIYDVREERELLFYTTGAFGTKNLDGPWCCSGQWKTVFIRTLNPKKGPFTAVSILCITNSQNGTWRTLQDKWPKKFTVAHKDLVIC
jgi:hypothetical protein